MNPPGYLSEFPYFEHNGDMYCSAQRFYDSLPRITGIPIIKTEKERGFIKEKKNINWYEPKNKIVRKFPYLKKKRVEGNPAKRSLKVPLYSKVSAPRICSFRKLINWPFTKWGGYQAAIVGNYGEGKSNLLNLFLAFHCAQKKVRILMFNDRRFEARSMADKGFFDKNKEFHPFHIDVFVPDGYEFKKANPMWLHRKNVHRLEWKQADDIISAMKPYHLNVVYTECFDQESRIKLWMDLMEILAEELNPNKNYIFAHHEFSRLIPETPTKNMAKLVKEASDVALNLRKDRIGLLTTFHMLSEVYYRFSHKYTYVVQKKPIMRRQMSRYEYDARNFKKSQFNIVFGGRWMKHDIGLFPEVSDEYRLIPKREKISYPDLKTVIESENTPQLDDSLIDPVNVQILRLRARGFSYQEIGDSINLTPQAVHKRAKKIGIV